MTLLLLAALAASCGEDSPGSGADSVMPPDLIPPGPVVDLRADVNRDGVVSLTDPTEDANEQTWDAKHGAVFLANIDDDDLSCPAVSASISDDKLAACNDAADTAIDGQKDLLDLARLKIAPWPAAPEGAAGSLAMSLPNNAGSDALAHARLFIDRDGTFKVLGSSDGLSTAELRKGVELALEGKDIVRDPATWDGYLDVKLTVTYTEGGKPSSKSDTVRLRVAPLVTSHHLQPLQTLYVSKLGDQDSNQFISDFGAVMNKAVPAAKMVTPSNNDQWTQDLFETGWMSMPAAGGKQHVVNIFIRSANVESKKDPIRPLRLAGRVVFSARGVDVGVVQEYDLTHSGQMDSLNSLGNLETSPPFTHAGVSYPLGRMIMGKTSGFFPAKTFTTMLEAQKVQKPIWLDTAWLLVGHTDETISFIKAKNTRGWLLVLNDPTLARTMLQAQVTAGNGSVKMFSGKYWLDNSWKEVSAEKTISQVLADSKVMAESAKAAVEVAAQLATLKKELGITDAEIVKIPYLHYAVDGYSVAYQPGTVNGTLIGDADFVAPEPHGPVIGGKDIFKEQMDKAFAVHRITVHYVEDWDLYHRLLGEVHCGSNALRAHPGTVKWWESGR